MKARMDIPINTPANENEQLRQAMQQTAQAALAAKKFAGTVAASPESAKLAVDLGYQIIIGGGDIAFLRNSAGEQLAKLEKAIGRDRPDRKADKSGLEVYGR